MPTTQTLEKELNKIFKPALASVKLSTATPINIQYANGENFVHGGSGLLSVYSEDEKNAIKALQNADNETYYLFVVDNVTRLNEDGTPMKDILAGYMPIGYQCGFLFGSPAAKYVAHELGHGAFGLHHTFSSETESFSAPQYSTNNLMDYAEGATLNHKQWRWMHEKHGKGLFGFLADEEEGEAIVSDNVIVTILNKIKNDNLKSNSGTDLTIWVNTESFAENMKLSDELSLDYIGMQVMIGKMTSTQDNPLQIEPLLINPIALHTEPAETPDGQEGEFVKVFYNRLENNTDLQIESTESSNLAISFVVKKSQLKDLQNLLGIPSYANLKLYEGTKEEANDAIMYITAEPEPVMPDVRVSVKSNFKIQMQLKIEYTARKSWPGHNNELVRNDVTYFPNDNADSWEDLQSEEIWDIDFGDKFRGGRAVVYCKIDNQLVDSIVFHIRGKNPQLTTVLAYAQTIDPSWYVPKIIRQESSNNENVGKQFNTGNPSSTNQVNGMPCWGYPYGWGIKQLDNLGSSLGYYTEFNSRYGASPDELWNWKLNVQKGLQLFNNSKLSDARKKWNNQLSKTEIKEWLRLHDALSSYSMKIESSTIDSEEGTIVTEIIAGSGVNTETIVSEENPQGNNRSLIDADAVKRYNGGSYYDKLEVPPSDSSEEPKWIITKTNQSNLDYVNEVCGKQGW